MPVPVVVPSGPSATVVNKASKLPTFAWDALKTNPVNANVILPILLKCLAMERHGETPRDHLWIVIYTHNPHLEVKVILSCTDGITGRYPIFIFTPIRYSRLQYDNSIRPSLVLLAQELLKYLPVERVYSIFAPDVISRAFATVWTQLTGIHTLAQPYYEAKVSYLTRTTFINRELPLPPDYECELRPAVAKDIPEIARLCYKFAGESPPFELSRDGAMYEATKLVENEQVWVHKLAQRGYPGRIVSIVAFTRNSDRVATITKVYTDPECRGSRCAERLVRRVCKQLLSHKEKVALFVGLTNRAANVYRRVGFVGVGDNAAPADGVDTWVELGFDPARVTLGHW